MPAGAFISFREVQFAYPPAAEYTNEEAPPPIFSRFTADLPDGFVSLVGPNAAGKSTLMLLAAGRILPQTGKIYLFGKDTSLFTEEGRDAAASFIYQNMEFETQDPAGELLSFVYANGQFKGKAVSVLNSGGEDLHTEIIRIMELHPVLGRPLQSLSKGEMQRALIAFSLLYGSRSIFMDEPLFAMEQYQKEAALAYIKAYVSAKQIPVYLSMHELELTRRYADTVMLFHPDRTIEMGTAAEVLTPDALENAYGVPASMLKDAETLTRRNLLEAAQQYRSELQ